MGNVPGADAGRIKFGDLLETHVSQDGFQVDGKVVFDVHEGLGLVDEEELVHFVRVHA